MQTAHYKVKFRFFKFREVVENEFIMDVYKTVKQYHTFLANA
jgi:hypothetical protein